MNILVINCGSSSVKYQLFEVKATAKIKSLVKGIAEKIGRRGSYLQQEKGKQNLKISLPLPDYFKAIEKIVGLLTHPVRGLVKDKRQIMAIGHRVVHGQEEFKKSVVIDRNVLRKIKYYGGLAPLHNPPAYNGVKAAIKIFPGIKQVAVFDTAFHQTLPEKAYLYALPYELYAKYHLRRYGFHGTSHCYVANEGAKRLKKPLRKLKLITCHLGNGCSITAVKQGSSVDTSMGFTPLEGLVMGTRCGDIDPALVSFLMAKEKLSISQVDILLNRKSGLLGLSGISNDMRELLKFADKGNQRARLAIEIFIYRLKKYIGAYTAVMNGVDAIILTAGIGENMKVLKQRLKAELNNVLPKKVKILTIHTDEESLIALETAKLVKAN